MIKRFFTKSKPIKLGRWAVDESQRLKNVKIDLANCDSWGTCGTTTKVKKNKLKVSDKEVLMAAQLGLTA